MRKILSVVLETVKVCLNVLMGALCFLKIEHDVAYLPNAEGGGKNCNFSSILLLL